MWSGESLFSRRIISDFRVVSSETTSLLSFILCRAPHNFQIWPELPEFEFISNEFPEGVGVVLNSSYAVQQTVTVFNEPETFDMHEFNILHDGKSALIITRQTKYYSSPTDVDEKHNGWVVYNHFRDVDISSNEVKFHWSTEDHIPLSESYEEPPNGWGAPGVPRVKWDYM